MFIIDRKSSDLILICITLLAFLFPISLSAQDKAGLTQLQTVITTHPDSLEAHQAYIKAIGVENPELPKQYERWHKQFPVSAIVPFAIGASYVSHELPQAKPWLLKAVAIDPQMASAWNLLSQDASRWGDFNAANAYLGKAAAAEPNNPDYVFYYASSFSNLDLETYREKSLEVARRFPEHERGAQALYWLAIRDKTPEKKAARYEKLMHDFPPGKFRWSSYGADSYYGVALESFPEKAVEIARTMNELKPEEESWSNRIVMSEGLIKAKNLIAAKKPEQALVVLEGLKPERYPETSKKELIVTRSAALDASGKTQGAYDSLIDYYSGNPQDDIKLMITTYGKKLGKKSEQIEADIWKHLDEKAEPATAFRLKDYKGPDSYVSLADYKGKVLLVTYWFPGCGPCRGEFPHFENVLKKYSKDQVAYVGINMVPEQDEYVLPFMESSGYSFTPVRDDPDNRGNLTARGAPTNYLIDTQGRIVFSHFRTDENNERTLELMIDVLLDHN